VFDSDKNHISIIHHTHNGIDPLNFNIKFTVRQANTIHKYKDLKLKFINCNANIYFNRQCPINYANKIKIPNTSPAATTTQRKAQIQRIKDELKFLYKKKQHLNTELYNAHLKAAQEWNGTWHLISNCVHATVNLETTKKYNTKLDRLSKQQTKHPVYNTEFYLRVVNNTNILFSNDELSCQKLCHRVKSSTKKKTLKCSGL
jgi:hypothetical protein